MLLFYVVFCLVRSVQKIYFRFLIKTEHLRNGDQWNDFDRPYIVCLQGCEKIRENMSAFKVNAARHDFAFVTNLEVYFFFFCV